METQLLNAETKIIGKQKTIKKILLIASLLFFNFNTHAQVGSLYSFSTGTSLTADAMTAPTMLLQGGFLNDDSVSALTSFTSITNGSAFAFRFNGLTYTNFSASTNGLLVLGARNGSTDASNLLVSGTSNYPKIAPYWDDLHLGTVAGGGKIHCKMVGTAPNRKLVVEWFVTVPKSATAVAAARFQVWLFESGHATTPNLIQFVYGSGLVANTGAFTVGIANASAATNFWCVTTSAHTASSSTGTTTNTAALAAPRSYTFTPNVPACLGSFLPANGASSQSTATTLSWSSVATATGYDVYFDTSAGGALIQVATNQAGLTYNPGALTAGKTYQWKVVPRNTAGFAISCPTNSFTTLGILNYNVSRSTGISYNSISSYGDTIKSWRNGLSETDDNLSDTIQLGFSFSYQGINRTKLLVSTNGFVTFNTTTPVIGTGDSAYSPENRSIGYSGTGGSLLSIAPFYEDLVCVGNDQQVSNLQASIKYKTEGTVGSRVFTVEWKSMETYGNSGPDLSFQLKLYEGSNNIEFVYGSMQGFNGTSESFNYSYSNGISGAVVNPSPLPGQLFLQQLGFENTRNFSNNILDELSNPNGYLLDVVPECNSRILFTPGNYSPYVHVSTIPVNDEPAGAIFLPSNSLPCTNLCGTYYSSDSATASGVPVCIGFAHADVWFSFVATSPATTINVRCSGSYDAVVELFDNGMNSLVCGSSVFLGGSVEVVTTTTLTVGNTYYIRVYNFLGNFIPTNGTFSICINATPVPPVNDDCLNAIQIIADTVLNAVSGTNTTGATPSVIGPAACSTTVADDDVWYSFDAPGPLATVTVQSASLFNAAVQVFSGSCGVLIPLQCVNSTGTQGIENVFLTGLEQFETYYVRVYNAPTGAGSGNFTIGVTAPSPGCPTVFSPPNASSNVSPFGVTLRWNKAYSAATYNVYLDTLNPPVNRIATNISDTSFFTGPLVIPEAQTFYWQVISRNTLDTSDACYVNLFSPLLTDATMYIKTFIEGLYIGNGTLRPILDPINKSGVVDSILVTLHDTLPPYDSLYSFKSELDTSGSASGTFPPEALGSFYHVSLKIHSALETWSKPILFDTPNQLIDFTTKPDSVINDTNNRVPGSRMASPINPDNQIHGTIPDGIDTDLLYMINDPDAIYLNLSGGVADTPADINELLLLMVLSLP